MFLSLILLFCEFRNIKYAGFKIVDGARKFVPGSKLSIQPDINPRAHKSKNSRRERTIVQPLLLSRLDASGSEMTEKAKKEGKSLMAKRGYVAWKFVITFADVLGVWPFLSTTTSKKLNSDAFDIIRNSSTINVDNNTTELSFVMNIDNNTTEMSFVQQRLHEVYATCQSYTPLSSREHTRDCVNASPESTVLSVASDIDCQSSCPNTGPGPIPVEMTTVGNQQMLIEFIIDIETKIELIKTPNSVSDRKSQTIESLLPDEDNLFSGVPDILGCIATAKGDDEDYDCSAGGMELEGNSKIDFRQRNSVTSEGRTNDQNSSGFLISCEHPSRTLLVNNVDNKVTDSELRLLFEDNMAQSDNQQLEYIIDDEYYNMNEFADHSHATFAADPMDSDFEHDSDQSIADTSAEEARNGKDIQGPWERLNFTREKYRETRLLQYKNYKNLDNSHDGLEKECKIVNKGHTFYDFQFNTRLVKLTVVHFQVMAISVISVSSDSSEDSMGPPVGRVILFDTIS
ncbi:hypothetical protein Tco_0510736 [Tanacetum coccineum]